MSLINQIEAKNKTKRVIESCDNEEHYEVAERMVKYYNEKYEDFVGYNELKRLLKKIKNEKRIDI